MRKKIEIDEDRKPHRFTCMGLDGRYSKSSFQYGDGSAEDRQLSQRIAAAISFQLDRGIFRFQFDVTTRFAKSFQYKCLQVLIHDVLPGRKPKGEHEADIVFEGYYGVKAALLLRGSIEDKIMEGIKKASSSLYALISSQMISGSLRMRQDEAG